MRSDIDATLDLSIVGSLDEVSAEDWNALAGDENPFVRYEHLHALETEGCVGERTGWFPRHVLVHQNGQLVGAMPAYLKNNSYGEFVFDWAFADAYERAGLDYYPKLVCAVPFTPATGPRLLANPGPEENKIRDHLLAAALAYADREKLSSAHWLFPQHDHHESLCESGLVSRIGYQFHWENQGYESFDDFLSELTSRKRKSIKKERKNALQNGIKISALNGNDIKSFHWDAFYDFYLDTTEKKWGGAYLNKAFFELIGERMSDKILLIIAEYNGQPVGGALNFIGKTTLFGRNWGCTADFKFLHFEACYYQAIDFAISNKIVSVEAGAQGHHKLQRGYLPTLTHSTHFISDTRFRAAVEGFLKKETQQILFEKQELDKMSPFKK